jgi:hypothetical protein
MKTLKKLTTSLLLIASTGIFAKGANDKIADNKSYTKEISGSPEDIDVKDIEALKDIASATVAYPAFVFTEANDFNANDIELLKETGLVYRLPALVTGSADDINLTDIEALKEIGSEKLSYPVLDPSDFNVEDIEELKNAGKLHSLPGLVIASPADINVNDIEALIGI